LEENVSTLYYVFLIFLHCHYTAQDGALEENISTLDYAARAKRVTNHVMILSARSC